MSRKVSPELPEDGLLVAWSLEGSPREKVYGFGHDQKYQEPAKFLEPIIQTGEGHIITVAPTGTGKGVSAIIPALLRYKGPTVILDPKAENYHVSARRREELGHQVLLLDPFDVAGPDCRHKASFNPMDFIDPSAQSFVEDVEMICNILASDEINSGRDVFWPNMGYQLLIFLILYQFLELSPDKHNLVETRRLLGAGMDDLARLGKSLADHKNEDLRALVGTVLNPAETTFGGYWSLAQSMMSFVKGEMLEKQLSSSSFSLTELVDSKPVTIYLVVPPEKLRSHSRLIKLWLSTFISALTQRTVQPEKPTLFLIDEAAQLGHMPQLETAITLLRGYGVKVWSFWQDLSQIKRLYPNSWETILNNCAVHQFFGQSTELAARDVHHVSGFGSPSDIRKLDQSEMVLCAGGDDPVLAQKPNYLMDEPFRGLFDDNPFYAGSETIDRIGRSRRIFKRSNVLDETLRKHTPKPRDKNLSLLERRLKSHPIAPDRWTTLTSNDKKALLDKLETRFWMPEFADGSKVSLRYWSPSYYENVKLFEVLLKFGDEEKFGYFVEYNDEFAPLLGGSIDIMQLNEKVGLILNADTLLDYLSFYCANHVSGLGRMYLVDEPEELVLSEDVDDEYYTAVLEALIEPEVTTIVGDDQVDQGYEVTASVLCGKTLAHIDFLVLDDGSVTFDNVREQFKSVPTIGLSELNAARLQWREKAIP